MDVQNRSNVGMSWTQTVGEQPLKDPDLNLKSSTSGRLKAKAMTTNVTEKVTKDTKRVKVKKVTTVTTSRHAGEKEVKKNTKVIVTTTNTRDVTTLGTPRSVPQDCKMLPERLQVFKLRQYYENKSSPQGPDKNIKPTSSFSDNISPSANLNNNSGKPIINEYPVEINMTPLQNKFQPKEEDSVWHTFSLGDKYSKLEPRSQILMASENHFTIGNSSLFSRKDARIPTSGQNKRSAMPKDSLSTTDSTLTYYEDRNQVCDDLESLGYSGNDLGRDLFYVTGIEKAESSLDGYIAGHPAVDASQLRDRGMTMTSINSRPFLDCGRIWALPSDRAIPKRRKLYVTCYKDYLKK